MKKLFLIGALLSVLCSCGGSGNSQKSHEYVDLGLPSGVKWATCNVGASNPGDCGDYYTWGATVAKPENISYSRSSGDISGNLSYDAAAASWGGNWRLPTRSEFQELLDCCTWTWANQDGNDGYKIIGPNGNSIFLPAAGFFLSDLKRKGDVCNYWSSTPIGGDAYSLYCGHSANDIKNMNRGNRIVGCCVRPVQGEKKQTGRGH